MSATKKAPLPFLGRQLFNFRAIRTLGKMVCSHYFRDAYRRKGDVEKFHVRLLAWPFYSRGPPNRAPLLRIHPESYQRINHSKFLYCERDFESIRARVSITIVGWSTPFTTCRVAKGPPNYLRASS